MWIVVIMMPMFVPLSCCHMSFSCFALFLVMFESIPSCVVVQNVGCYGTQNQSVVGVNYFNVLATSM